MPCGVASLCSGFLRLSAILASGGIGLNSNRLNTFLCLTLFSLFVSVQQFIHWLKSQVHVRFTVMLPSNTHYAT